MTTGSVQACGFDLLERFEFGVARLRWRGRAVEAPIVDGWLQIEREVLRVPTELEDRAFFADFLAVRSAAAGIAWYWLRKPPGLKLRFRVRNDAALAARVLEAVAALQISWLGETSIGSYFDQVEIRPLAFRCDAETWLHVAAEALAQAAERGDRVDHSAWTTVLVEIGRRTFRDDWIAYEAFARLERLRAPFRGAAVTSRTFDPCALPRLLPKPRALGFEASIGFLQTLNLIFNVWALDGAGTSAALSAALNVLRPMLLDDRQ